MMDNIPVIKLGLVAVSRDCFPIALSEKRRAAIAAKCGQKELNFVEIKTTVENELDMLKAVEELKAAGCNAACVFLGNFGPETPETLIAEKFDGPVMFVAAAEGDGDMINGRGDAYCGMLNCSYNLGMRHLKGYIPEYPVGTAEELADKIAEFVPIARAIIGIITRAAARALIGIIAQAIARAITRAIAIGNAIVRHLGTLKSIDTGCKRTQKGTKDEQNRYQA